MKKKKKKRKIVNSKIIIFCTDKIAKKSNQNQYKNGKANESRLKLY